MTANGTHEYVIESALTKHYGVSSPTIEAWRKAGKLTPTIEVPRNARTTVRLYRVADLPARDQLRRGMNYTVATRTLLALIDTQASHLSDHADVQAVRRLLNGHDKSA